MKKTLFLMLLFLLIQIGAFAQTSTHLTFKGIPIDGDFKSFEKKMKEKGFDNTFTLSSKAFKGSFASYDNCTAVVNLTSGSNTVYQIMVVFDTGRNWLTIENMYSKLKKELTSKYGEPIRDVSFFRSPYEYGDGYEITAIKENSCVYNCLFETDKGKILLLIGDFEIVGNGFISVAYLDKQNELLNNKEEHQLISNDL